MKSIGVFTIDPWTLLDESSVKKELLYFDHLKYTIHGKDILEKFCNTLYRRKNWFKSRMDEIEDLEKAGLVSEYSNHQANVDAKNFVDNEILTQAYQRLQLSESFSTQDKKFEDVFVDFLERFREVGELDARSNAILLNKTGSELYVPIIRNPYQQKNADSNDLKVAKTLSVVVSNFPTVSSGLPIEQLKELKSDGEANLKLHRLRTWISDVVGSPLSEKEINQKIEYLLLEYKYQLDLHKLKYDVGIIETCVTVGLEVFENIVKLNLSKAASALFEIQRRELALLESEENLVGRELAYLHYLRVKLPASIL